MNEITNLINDYSSPSNENCSNKELHSAQEQIDSSLKSLDMSMIQLRQIINILNSQFYNSSNSITDNSQTSIKMYFELFQAVVKGLKPAENIFQNPNLIANTLNNKFEKLYFKFITDFIELMLAINLPKEVFIPICNFFSPLLVIFMRNLINEKTNISQEDFSLIAQLNQGSFIVFESLLKQLFMNCFNKLDLIYTLIQENDNGNNKSQILNNCFVELKKSLIWNKKNTKQHQILLSTIFTIRCELISLRANKIKLSSLINDIETNAKIAILYDNANKSLNDFVNFLNTPNLIINVTTQFSNCGDLQSFYSKVNNFQLLELKRLYDENLIPYEFTDEMKTILENIFNYKENSILDKVFSLVDVQLYDHHHHHNQQENDEDRQNQEEIDKENDDDKKKKEDFDLKLKKMIPPTNYDQTIDTFLDFIRNPDIGSEIPITLKKDMMTLQIAEVVTTFKKDKLNHPIQNERDYLEECYNELSFLMNKVITISSSENPTYENNKSSLFLKIYVHTIKILLIAKDIYKDKDEDFKQISDTFCKLIPPSTIFSRMLNIDERFQKLKQASYFLMEETTHFSLNEKSTKIDSNGVDDDENEDASDVVNYDDIKEKNFIPENDKDLNDEKILFFSSNDSTNKLVFELDVATIILSFIEKHEKLIELLGFPEFSADIWPDEILNETGDDEENVIYADENKISASLKLLTVFTIEGFNFDYTPDFFINWIIFNFSTINRRVEPVEISSFIPFCDYSELLGTIINSCTLVELYSRISNSDEFVNAAESMKFSTLAFLIIPRFDEAQLTRQVQKCIKESRNTSMFNRINVLCHKILNKICSIIQLSELSRYVQILNPNKTSLSITLIEVLNYSIEILNKLKLVSNSDCLPIEIKEQIDDVGQRLSLLIEDPETSQRPLFFSQEFDDLLVNVFSILNEIRKIVDTYDITLIASKVSNYIDELLIYYETQQDENCENSKNAFSADTFNAIFSLKRQVDELFFANKMVNAEVAVVKMQLILDKAQKTLPRLDKPLDEFYEILNVSYAIFSIKTLLNFVYLEMSQYSKNGVIFENWFDGEFDGNFAMSKDEENAIDYQFTNLIDCISKAKNLMSDLQDRISNISSEISQQDLIGSASRSPLNYNNNNNSRQEEILAGISKNFLSLTNFLRTRLSALNDRKISQEVPQLEKECDQLFQDFVSFPNQSQNLLNIYKKINLRIHPSSNKLVTQFESNALQLNLKNITIKEMERKIEILQEELNKRQNQINKTVDSSFIDSKKKQKERLNQLIGLIKESVSNSVSSNNNNNDNDNKDEIFADDPNYDIIQKLKKKLNDIDQENLQLKNEIREIELHHQISREDQIDLLMNKACNFPNPNNSSDMDEKISSGNSKKDNDAFNKQVSELNQSIEKMKKKIQVDKKQGSTEASFIKLLKDVRPREFPEALINEDMFKQATKTTRERAEKLMKEWKTLRADLDAFESGM